LEEQPDLAASEGDVGVVHQLAGDLDTPLAPRQQTNEQIQKGRLPGAVWSQQGDRFTFLQPEVNARESLGSIGIPKAKIFDLQ
jgi:hypothetical protein